MTDLISIMLPGLSEMLNIHPLLVHFPIAMFAAFLITDLLAFLLNKEKLRYAATVMLYIGTIGAVATVASGLMAANSVSHGEQVHPIMHKHKYLGIIVLCISLFLSNWRYSAGGISTRRGQGIQILFSILMVAVMSIGADLGGMMVYKYGVSVIAVPQPQGHNHSKSDHQEEIPDEGKNVQVKKEREHQHKHVSPNK